jgi:uncharacterized protein (TIRG00374 family)
LTPAPVTTILPLLASSRRTWLWLAIAAVIAIAAFSAIGDIRHVGDRLADFAWSAFAAALALANYVLRFARWQLYLSRQGVRVPTGSSALVFGSGLSLSITPGKLGELVKAFLLRELHDVPVTLTAPIVVAERVTDLIALVVLAVVGVAAYGLAPAFVAVAASLVAVGLVLLAWTRPTRALIDFVTAPARMRRLREPLHETLGHLATLCRPLTLVAATAIAVPAWGCECLGFALICNAFPGVHIELGLAAAIYAGTTIAGALSFLPGGLGVTEGAMTLALIDGAAHMDRATAVDATLLTRLATLWFAVVLGVVFLAVARRRIRKRVV